GVIVHRRGPGDVVHGAGASEAGGLGRLLVPDPAAACRVARLPPAVLLLEAERRQELGARLTVGADALEALQRDLPRDLGVSRHERLVFDVRDDELVREPLRVVEAEPLAVRLDLAAL